MRGLLKSAPRDGQLLAFWVSWPVSLSFEVHCGSAVRADGGGSQLAAHRSVVTVARQALGKTAEDLAAAELERRGYAILARRYRTAYGEIDIVARDGETTVFVEVKARATAEFGTAAEAVTPRKQRKLTIMATDYLARHQLCNVPCRFDVVAIDDAGTCPRVTVYANAFDGAFGPS